MNVAALPVDVTERLAAAAAGGDRIALGQLFTHYSPAVYGYVYRRVNARQVAEDITAEVWLRVTRAIGKYSHQAGGGFRAWLFTIARHLLLTRWRDAQRAPLMAAETALLSWPCTDPGPEAEAVLRERDATVAAALETLPEPQRTCMQLRYLDGLSEAETAARMSRSVGSVKMLTHRAKLALRKTLTPALADRAGVVLRD